MYVEIWDKLVRNVVLVVSPTYITKLELYLEIRDELDRNIVIAVSLTYY